MSQIEQTRSSGSQDQGTVERVQEGVQAAGEQAKTQLQEQKGKAGERVREQVDQRSTEFGERAHSLASALRSTGEELRSGDSGNREAELVDRAAGGLDRVGQYLTETDGRRMLDDVEEFGRRRPWAVAAAGAVLGLMAARMLKASSTRRYEMSSARLHESGRGSMTAGPRSGYQPVS